ncbi:hypothetical protein D3C86_2096750 [compost metagenome]
MYKVVKEESRFRSCYLNFPHPYQRRRRAFLAAKNQRLRIQRRPVQPHMAQNQEVIAFHIHRHAVRQRLASLARQVVLEVAFRVE